MSIRTKQLIWTIREREHGCCGQKIACCGQKIAYFLQKIAYFLQKENQISLSVPTVYEALAEKYTLRPQDRKNHKRGDVPEADAARQVIQMDTVHFGGFPQTIQTDGGSEFEAELAAQARLCCLRHRIARPYKKNEQSFIESFNRTVRSEFLGRGKNRVEEMGELTQEVEAFLERYHYHRPHLAFDLMRPR